MTEAPRGSWMGRLAVPSPVDLVFLLFLLVMPLTRGWQALNTDGDLGRHIRLGETMISRRAILRQDEFSYTMAGRTLVPYEWLSEVAFASAHRAGGFAGVLAMVGIIIAATYALTALLLQRSDVDPLLGFLTAVAAGLAGAFHWLARPHVFTLLAAVLLLYILVREPRRGAWLVGGLFVMWANLHGGFLYGLVMIALFMAGAGAELLRGTDPARWRPRLRQDGILLGAALAGSAVTPSGLGLFAHVTGYLGKTYLVDHTAEYQSPDFHLWYGRVFLLLLLALVAGFGLSRRRVPLPWLAVVLANVAFATISARNIPLFAVTALPLAAMHLDPEWRALRWALLTRIRAAFAHASSVSRTGPWAFAGALGILFLGWGHGSAFGRQVLLDRLSGHVFPVEAIERARSAHLNGRLFHEFTWGGYLLLAWPEQRVFIDGQTDFYGENLVREYALIRGAGAGWREALDRYRVDLLLVQPQSPLYRAALAIGWLSWHEDATAAVLERPKGLRR